MVKELLAISCILLCGCQQVHQVKDSHWDTSETKYLKSTANTSLKVPAELSLKQDFEAYPLPQNIPAPGSVKPVPLEPPGFGKLEASN